MKRYSWSTDFMEWWDDGDYVLYSDHEEEVARLRAEAKGLSQALTDALACEQDYLREISDLRAEADANRVDAERYRWIKRKCSVSLSNKEIFTSAVSLRGWSVGLFLPFDFGASDRGCCGEYGVDENARRDCGFCDRRYTLNDEAIDAAMGASA